MDEEFPTSAAQGYTRVPEATENLPRALGGSWY
jgi:hypothetical protein